MKTVEQRLESMTDLEQLRIVRGIRVQHHRLNLEVIDMERQGFSLVNMDKLHAIQRRYKAQYSLLGRIQGKNVASLYQMAAAFSGLQGGNR